MHNSDQKLEFFSNLNQIFISKDSILMIPFLNSGFVFWEAVMMFDIWNGQVIFESLCGTQFNISWLKNVWINICSFQVKSQEECMPLDQFEVIFYLCEET